MPRTTIRQAFCVAGRMTPFRPARDARSARRRADRHTPLLLRAALAAVPAELDRPLDEQLARNLAMVVPPRGERLDRPREHLCVDLEAGAAVVDRRAARPGGDQARDDAGRPALDARDERPDLRVGGVAEQRAPRLAVLLDEREERVDAVAKALLAVLPALHRSLDAGEDLGRLGIEQRPVELALGGEVLVDERLRHAGRVGDVVEGGAVVAAAAERLLSRSEDDLAALGGGHAATTGRGRHGGASGRWRRSCV